jgi:hypothetical protein
LKSIKKNVSMMLDIASDQLNEISLEDVEIQQAYQHHIYKTLYDMVALDDLYNKVPDGQDESPRVPCTGFWVEGTQELVLFAWCQHRSKTIVIPPEEWFLRDDITVH